MTTQVSFTTDVELKNKALQKAKNEGITLKTLLVYAMKGFVDGKISLGLTFADSEPEVEELHFTNKTLNQKVSQLAKLLK